MRAGMRRDWTAALAGFDARYYTNRLGLESVRADESTEVQAALAAAGATTVASYGVRLFSDHWDSEDRPADLAPSSTPRSKPASATPTGRSPLSPTPLPNWHSRVKQ